MKLSPPPVTAQWLNDNERREVKLFYRRHLPYARPNKKERILTLSSSDPASDTEILAAVRLRTIGQFTLLTGMLVAPDYRGQQLAHQLMQILNKALEKEMTFLFALPHLAPFYRQYGFVSQHQAPKDIEQLYQKYNSKHKPLILMTYCPTQGCQQY